MLVLGERAPVVMAAAEDLGGWEMAARPCVGAGGATGPLLLPDCGWWQRLVAGCAMSVAVAVL